MLFGGLRGGALESEKKKDKERGRRERPPQGADEGFWANEKKNRQRGGVRENGVNSRGLTKTG